MNKEIAWVDAAVAGDTRAFDRLVERYQKPVFSLAFRMLGNRDEAEDAAQEAFLKAYRALGSYDRRRSFSTWLLSITAHHCIDRLRKKRLKEISLDGMPSWRAIPAKTADPIRSVEQHEREQQISRLLAQLSDKDRLMVVLLYWHEMGYAEIATITGTSVSAVKSRLHRARRHLAELLKSEIDQGPPSTHKDAAAESKKTQPALVSEAVALKIRIERRLACNVLMPVS